MINPTWRSKIGRGSASIVVKLLMIFPTPGITLGVTELDSKYQTACLFFHQEILQWSSFLAVVRGNSKPWLRRVYWRSETDMSLFVGLFESKLWRSNTIFFHLRKSVFVRCYFVPKTHCTIGANSYWNKVQNSYWFSDGSTDLSNNLTGSQNSQSSITMSRQQVQDATCKCVLVKRFSSFSSCVLYCSPVNVIGNAIRAGACWPVSRVHLSFSFAQERVCKMLFCR